MFYCLFYANIVQSLNAAWFTSIEFFIYPSKLYFKVFAARFHMGGFLRNILLQVDVEAVGRLTTFQDIYYDKPYVQPIVNSNTFLDEL